MRTIVWDSDEGELEPWELSSIRSNSADIHVFPAEHTISLPVVMGIVITTAFNTHEAELDPSESLPMPPKTLDDNNAHDEYTWSLSATPMSYYPSDTNTPTTSSLSHPDSSSSMSLDELSTFTETTGSEMTIHPSSDLNMEDILQIRTISSDESHNCSYEPSGNGSALQNTASYNIPALPESYEDFMTMVASFADSSRYCSPEPSGNDSSCEQTTCYHSLILPESDTSLEDLMNITLLSSVANSSNNMSSEMTPCAIESDDVMRDLHVQPASTFDFKVGEITKEFMCYASDSRKGAAIFEFEGGGASGVAVKVCDLFDSATKELLANIDLSDANNLIKKLPIITENSFGLLCCYSNRGESNCSLCWVIEGVIGQSSQARP
ncbi:hypothetical protein BJX63DRAFT_432443 [Aspergillus granulosus]|uniref:Uncharacterized protein n=1 Tax=Aspergillus granulosus TaxID=176169 RepID=A0ABR4HBA6_9EURO